MDLIVADRLGMTLDVNAPGVASTSRGLVGDTVFAVMPEIKPIHTFMITILFQSVSAYLSTNPSRPDEYPSNPDLLDQALDHAHI